MRVGKYGREGSGDGAEAADKDGFALTPEPAAGVSSGTM